MVTDSKQKRHFDGEDTPALKRTKQDIANANPSLSTKFSQFECFHLHLLQSLYNTDSNIPLCRSDDDSVGSFTNDELSDILEDTVDDQFWAKAHKFVRERDQLIKLKEEARKVNIVHQEALNYMEEKGSETPVPSTPSGKQSLAPFAHRTSSTGLSGAIKSPSSLAFFSPQQSMAPFQTQDPLNYDVITPTKCFGLVATLLQSRCRSFNAKMKHHSNPYGSVLKEVLQEVEAIEGKLQKLQVVTLSKQQQEVEELLSYALVSSYSSEDSKCDDNVLDDYEFDMKSLISKLETKLQLWKMLAADLRNVVLSADN